MSPTVTSRCVVPADNSSTRPRQVHVPAKKLRRSQASTAGSVYAARGSMTDSACGRSEAAKAVGSTRAFAIRPLSAVADVEVEHVVPVGLVGLVVDPVAVE